jgi:protein-tyrosine phosphatase
LQVHLDSAEIQLRLVPGADNHMVQNFVGKLRDGQLLTLADSRYVLVEPPHHVAPPQPKNLCFDVLAASYVPVLTHPERLTWIEGNYQKIQRLAGRGVWMQITLGSLPGRFGKRARYWAERMLSEGLVQILATHAHDNSRRPPDLSEGR